MLEKRQNLEGTIEIAERSGDDIHKAGQYRQKKRHEKNGNCYQECGLYNHGVARQVTIVHFHEKVTADNRKHKGIHPMIALDSHQVNLGQLVAKALRNLPAPKDDSHKSNSKKIIDIYEPAKGEMMPKQKPDFISVTRGPGIRSSLSTGVDTAKGLAVAWQIPLIGINHMQAHALTSRLVSMLENPGLLVEPAFPFISLLVSGGHTLLVHSKSLISHQILSTTTDIAIGDCLDKCARHILPPTLLSTSSDTMYGRLLEAFAFPSSATFGYSPPANHAEELVRKSTRWGWALGAPLAETRSGSKSKSMEFSFTGTGSAVARIVENRTKQGGMGEEERKDIAQEAMRVVFEHLASRVIMALEAMQEENGTTVDTLVVSGGVASNRFLKHILRSVLDVRAFTRIKLSFPPPALCTDNAAMIAWTGMEMYEAGWESDLGIQAVRKWSIDPGAEDGGILGLEGWRRRGG